MPVPNLLVIDLLSDTTIGSGEGTAGAVDTEVEHDEYGLPCISGKTLHGLLRDSWLSMADAFPEALRQAAVRVYGPAGDTTNMAVLRIGNALLEDQTRAWARYAVNRANRPAHPGVILEAFTDIRHQTSEDRATGAPETTTLRQTRVVIRGVKLQAALTWMTAPTSDMLRCLALSALGLRHMGLSRNRGRGHVEVTCDGDPVLTRTLAKGDQT